MHLRLLILLAALLSPLCATPYGLASTDPDLATLPEKLPALRHFSAWEKIEPIRDDWDFSIPDKLVTAATQNGTDIHGILHQPPSWITDQNSASGFPLKDMRAWGTFVEKTIAHFPGITRWDVLDSYNTGSRQSNTPLDYVELLTVASREAKAANAEATIGFSLAGFDLEFLDEAMRSGAGRYFDYISLAPYTYAPGSEQHFATLLPTLRKLLAGYDIPGDLPVFITLRGKKSDLAIAAPLALSLGFEGVFLDTDSASLAEIPAKLSEPLPPAPSFADEYSVSLTFGENNISEGLLQHDASSTPWDEKLGAARLHVSGTHPILTTAFLVAPSFATPETRELEVSFEVRRMPDETGTTNPTGFVLSYESIHGIRTVDQFWPVPGDNKWHTKTWKLTDAKFEGRLGWNLRIDASGAVNDLLIRKVSITKQ